MSTLTGEGVTEVKTHAADKLLSMRVEAKLRTGKVNDVLNRVTVGEPKPRDNKERYGDCKLVITCDLPTACVKASVCVAHKQSGSGVRDLTRLLYALRYASLSLWSTHCVQACVHPRGCEGAQGDDGDRGEAQAQDTAGPLHGRRSRVQLGPQRYGRRPMNIVLASLVAFCESMVIVSALA